MHFLLTNDDGYGAEGLHALAREAQRQGHRVTVCAPDRERSCASHSFTAHTPLSARPFEEDGLRGWKVDGLPADCARLGLWLLREDLPDMVLSGINHGDNLGGATVYSGTVAAAIEASMCGVPSVALSMDRPGLPRYGFEPAARLALRFVRWAAERPLPQGSCYNVNIPDVPEVRRARLVPLSPSYQGLPVFREYVSPEGRTVYWTVENVEGMPAGTDVPVCREELCATVTPLTWNMGLPVEPAELEL